MDTITLPALPVPYTINLKPYIDVKQKEGALESSLYQKIQKIASFLFAVLHSIFVMIPEAFYTTLSYSWISFKLSVLGFYGSWKKFTIPKDFYLIIFKTAVWAIKLFLFFLENVTLKAREKLFPYSNLYLEIYTRGGIDLSHMQGADLGVDVSEVPENVTIDLLEEYFKQIDFQEQRSPFYMAPETRQEYSKTYTPEELKASLNKFVTDIRDRRPVFAGPNASDPEHFFSFYTQIEKSIRFALHEVSKKIDQFKLENGEDDSFYDEKQKRQYRNFIEDRSRIVIDMAIAGNHCAGRYMGESITAYSNAKGQGTIKGSLKDSLIEMLACKRNEIAMSEANKHFRGETHAVSRYVGQFGKILALPGSKGVVEKLARDLNQDQYLSLFFEEYTVNCVIETVQEKFKNSQSFREQILDWIKDQAGDWAKDLENPETLVHKIEKIRNLSINQELTEEYLQFRGLIQRVRQGDSINWPQEEGDSFIDEVFALPCAVEYFNEVFSDLTSIQKATAKQNIKLKFKEATLGSVQFERLKSAILNDKELPLSEIMDKEKRIKLLRETLQESECGSIEGDVLLRVLDRTCNIKSQVENWLDQKRAINFPLAIGLNKMMEEGELSSEIMEWVLVAHEIFMPQQIK